MNHFIHDSFADYFHELCKLKTVQFYWYLTIHPFHLCSYFLKNYFICVSIEVADFVRQFGFFEFRKTKVYRETLGFAVAQ